MSGFLDLATMSALYSTVLSVLLARPGYHRVLLLSLHDALPISLVLTRAFGDPTILRFAQGLMRLEDVSGSSVRSEEHTSELQSRQYLVCRLLLAKKKTQVTAVAGAGARRSRAMSSSGGGMLGRG